MKKHASIYILLWIAGILFQSCSDEFVKGVFIASNNEYSLNIQTPSLQSIPAEGGIIDSRIEASNAVSWSIQDLPEWMTTTMPSGTGSQDIKFNVEANESFTASRTHIFNIATTNSDWKVTLPVSVTQLKRDKRITLSPSDNSSWTFDSDGGHKSLNIAANVEWKAECKEGFVSLSKTSGVGDGDMIITVSSYKAIDVMENRTASIYFKEATSDEILQVLTITQTPLQSSVTTETITVDFDKKSNSKTFSLGTVSGAYSVSSDAAWLSIIKNKDTDVDVTLNCAANENDDERTTNAYVYFDNTHSIKYTFAVKQQGNIIVVDPSSITFDANGGSQTINVDSSTSWKVTNYNDWVSTQGNGSTCTVSANENNSLEQRTGEIFFNRINESGEIIGKTVKVLITQKGRQISPNVQTLQFGPEASSQILNIESDAQWTLNSVEDWISLSSSEGYGNKAITVSVLENAATSSRTGTLKLTCMDKTINIVVIQESAFLNTSSTAIELGAVGGSATISLSANVSWTATASESWLQLSPMNGSGEGTIALSADDNPTTSSRTAIITISSMLGEMKIYVRQLAPTISVSTNSVDFDYYGGNSQPIIITADGDYTIKTSDNWIHYNLDGNVITISVLENEGPERSGQIVISLLQVNVVATIKITQKAALFSFVDLGLPSGTKWCVWNLGAESECDYGDYLTWVNAKAQIPSECAMPTYDQARELVSKCSWSWKTINGVNGYRGIGPNGNYIFLPAGGIYEYYMGYLSYEGDEGNFWVNQDTTTEYSREPSANTIVFLHSAGVAPKISGSSQASRLNVRCVKK